MLFVAFSRVVSTVQTSTVHILSSTSMTLSLSVRILGSGNDTWLDRLDGMDGQMGRRVCMCGSECHGMYGMEWDGMVQGDRGDYFSRKGRVK